MENTRKIDLGFQDALWSSFKIITKIRSNTIRGTDYHQANLLQSETTHHVLGEFNTVKNDIIEALEDHNKENSNTSRVEVANNASSAKNDVLLTLNQSLEALTKEIQSLKKNNNFRNTNNTDKQTKYWDGVPF